MEEHTHTRSPPAVGPSAGGGRKVKVREEAAELASGQGSRKHGRGFVGCSKSLCFLQDVRGGGGRGRGRGGEAGRDVIAGNCGLGGGELRRRREGGCYLFW